MGSALAGWHPDPNDASGLRYFDGSEWTEHTRPALGAMPPSTTTIGNRSEASDVHGIRRRPKYDRGIDLRLSGAVTIVDLLLHVVLRWLAVGFGVYLVCFPFSIAVILLHLPAIVSLPAVVALQALPMVVATASLCRPVRIGRSEFFRLLDDSAGSSGVVYSKFNQGMMIRRTPIDELDRKQVTSALSGSSHDLLRITKDKLEVWVTAMDSGTDLWAGWTAWIRHYPIVMPFTYLKGLINKMIGKGSEFHEAVSQSEVRAVLFAIHHSMVDVLDELANRHGSLEPSGSPSAATNGSLAALNPATTDPAAHIAHTSAPVEPVQPSASSSTDSASWYR